MRADGYCFLIDRELFLRYGLDESFPFWWCFAKLQGELLRDGFSVKAIRNHKRILHHYGGKSGQPPKEYKQRNGLSKETVKELFSNRSVMVLDSLE